MKLKIVIVISLTHIFCSAMERTIRFTIADGEVKKCEINKKKPLPRSRDFRRRFFKKKLQAINNNPVLYLQLKNTVTLRLLLHQEIRAKINKIE